MNITVKKLLSLCLCAALCLGLSAAAFAENETVTKDETVYILTDSQGSTRKVIVSDRLENVGNGEVKDESVLSDIENVKGDESFTVDKGAIIWTGEGSDIYYQSTADRDLPISLRLSYTLDGEEISPKELAGKSGRVTIRFDYDSNYYELRDINGSKEKIYLPFAAVTGVILDNDVFTNIEVTNGRTVDDGDRTIVAGIAFPGLCKDIAIDSELVSVPDFVEITADADNFEMGITFTAASSQVFGNMDLTEPESDAELGDTLDALSSAVAELTAGVTQLSDGSNELLTGANGIADAVSQLSNGLATLTENNDALTEGAKQVFETIIGTANAQLSAKNAGIPALTVENYGEVIDAVLAPYTEEGITAAAEEQVEKEVRAQEAAVTEKVTAAVSAEVETQVTEAVKQSVLAKVMEAQGITEEIYTAMSDNDRAKLEAAAKQQMQGTEAKNTVAAKTKEQMNSADIKAVINEKTEEQIESLIEDNMKSEKVRAQINAGVKKAAEETKELRELRAQLDSYNEFYQGLVTYTQGVSAAAEGAGQLNMAMPEFVGGIRQLSDGIGKLLEGLKSETMGKIDLADFAARIRAISEVTENYRSFAGLSEGMDGQVKFIIRTDEIKK